MSQKIIILDFGMGNLYTVERKFRRLGVDVIVTSSPNELSRSDKIILPGVGNFNKAMDNLRSLNLIDSLNECVSIKEVPVLGICIGMQIMAKYSEEGEVSGLGWFDADVVKFRVNDQLRFKVPHVGWNQIEVEKDSRLMIGIPDGSEFYFVHSYHYKLNDNRDILNISKYSYEFVSAVEKNNMFGVQYHPEKSHDVGDKLLMNFVSL